MISVKCKNCGASEFDLKADGFCQCRSCGTKYILSDEEIRALKASKKVFRQRSTVNLHKNDRVPVAAEINENTGASVERAFSNENTNTEIPAENANSLENNVGIKEYDNYKARMEKHEKDKLFKNDETGFYMSDEYIFFPGVLEIIKTEGQLRDLSFDELDQYVFQLIKIDRAAGYKFDLSESNFLKHSIAEGVNEQIRRKRHNGALYLLLGLLMIIVTLFLIGSASVYIILILLAIGIISVISGGKLFKNIKKMESDMGAYLYHLRD